MTQKALLQGKIQGGYVLDKFLQWEEDDFTQSENKRECIPAVELLGYQIAIFSQGGYLNMAHENKPDISKSIHFICSIF